MVGLEQAAETEKDDLMRHPQKARAGEKKEARASGKVCGGMMTKKDKQCHSRQKEGRAGQPQRAGKVVVGSMPRKRQIWAEAGARKSKLGVICNQIKRNGEGKTPEGNKSKSGRGECGQWLSPLSQERSLTC